VGEAARTSRLSAAGRPSTARRLFLSSRITLADKWCSRQPLRLAEPFEPHLKSSIQGEIVRCIPDRSTRASIPRSGLSQRPLAGLSFISFCSSRFESYRAPRRGQAAERRCSRYAEHLGVYLGMSLSSLVMPRAYVRTIERRREISMLTATPNGRTKNASQLTNTRLTTAIVFLRRARAVLRNPG
jgi:hypothetical protein